jgi:hypothetical protein
VSAKRRCGGRSTSAQKEPEAELGRLYYAMREEVQMQRADRNERHSYWTLGQMGRHVRTESARAVALS